MTKKLKSGTPFVYDENDRVVGIRDPHTGTDTDLVTAVTSPGGGNRIPGGVIMSTPSAYLAVRETIVQPVVPLNVVHGRFVGVNASSVLHSSADGVVWTAIGAAPDSAGQTVASIYALNDGEVLLKLYRSLWRSAGWSAGAPTWTKVLETTDYGANVPWFAQNWSVQVAGQYVMASEYGTPKPNAHRSYLSTDGGLTFAVVFDQRTRYTIDGASNAHLHGCCIDTWHGTTPRLWQLSADAGFKGIWFSDDLGTTWTNIPAAGYSDYVGGTVEANNYTTITATKHGLLLSTDGPPDGVAYIPRDANYASSPRVITALSFPERESVIGYVGRAACVLDDEWIFALHDPSDTVMTGNFARCPGRVTATSVKSGLSYIVHEWTGADGQDFTDMFLYSDALWIRQTRPDSSTVTHKLPLYSSGDVREPGGAGRDWASRPGRTVAGSWNMALHPTAEARYERSIAIGPKAITTFQGQVAIGGSLQVDGEGAVGVAAPEVTAANCFVNGARSVGIGYRPKVSNSSVVCIGDRNVVAAVYGIAIGGQINIASGNSPIVIGLLSLGSNTETVCVGSYSEVTGQRASVLGSRAKATHTQAVAIGSYTETARADSVAVGNRDIELQGNDKGVILRSPNGTLYKLTVSDAGAVTVAAV